MVRTFLLFDTITNEETVKFMQRDIITSTITRHLGLVGSNNFGEYILPLVHLLWVYILAFLAGQRFKTHIALKNVV